MKSALNRRNFLKSTCVAGFAFGGLNLVGERSARAVEPIKRTGKSRIQLSLAAYSFRESFKAAAAKRINLDDFLDYCADQNLAGAELTSYYFPDPITDEYLIALKRHAFLRGIAISGSAVNNNFAVPKGEKRDAQLAIVKKWVDRSAVLGAPHIRIFAWPQVTDVAEAKKNCIEALEEACDYAGTKGVFLGLENHGSIAQQPDHLMDIIQAVKSPWLGVNLDTGNFRTKDPYADIARFAPYAVNVQYKVEIFDGEKKVMADMPRVIKILREANYQGFVALEHEAKEDPWKTVPGWLEKLRASLAA